MLRVLLLVAVWLRYSFAALPYIPTTALISRNNASLVYIFQPSSDSISATVIRINASTSVSPNSPAVTLTNSVPFLSGQNSAFTPFIDNNGNLYAFAGQCAGRARNSSLWAFKYGKDQETGDWTNLSLASGGISDDNPANAGGVNYLAAGFAFSTPLNNTPTLYTFGGMCPNTSISALSSNDWQASANYSNALLSLAPQGKLSSSSFASVATKDDRFTLAPVTSSRGPPIAEAGFSITGLMPLIDGPNQTNIQQNLVLIGGHTAEAFINMSQIAMMSLPEQSWSFIPIVNGQSSPSTGELVRREMLMVEPRSGHTAVLSEDGSQIIVLGGWVGDINTPAEPQLAILEVGVGYGGKGEWRWSLPRSTGAGFSGNGIYGHGAVILPGNIMMITGGNTIAGQGSKRKRDALGVSFYNITSGSWSTSYQNPLVETSRALPENTGSSGLRTGQKVGLGVGLGVGIPLFFLLLAVLFCLRTHRKKKDKRRSDLITQSFTGSGVLTGQHVADSQNSPHSMIESARSSRVFPHSGQTSHNRQSSDGPDGGWRNVRSMEAERTGLLVEIPSPTRGLRRGHTRNSSHFTDTASRHSVPIPVIAEADETETAPEQPPDSPFKLPELDFGKDFTGTKSPPPKSPSPRPPRNVAISRPFSDPFADPVSSSRNPFNSAPTSANGTPNESPEREASGWIEDWEAVQARIQARREARSQANPPSSANVSSEHSSVPTTSPETSNQHRVSPLSHRETQQAAQQNQSDRTESNISDKSMHSAVSFFTNKTGKSSNPSINRNISQRSGNLFSVIPSRIQRKPVRQSKPGRSSLPQAGAFSNAVSQLQGTPPGRTEVSPPGTSRSIALSPASNMSSPGQPRMPSFGTLQAESQALLGNPRSAATPITHIGHSTYIESHSADYIDENEDDEFPTRPVQKRSRGLVGSMRNVLGGRQRSRLNTAVSNASSTGSPTVATFSSGSPTRASTATPFSMLRHAAAAERHAQQYIPEETANYYDVGAGSSNGPRRTASVGSAPWRRRRSGARDWDWSAQSGRPHNEGQNLAPPEDQYLGKTSSSSEEAHRDWRRSSPGAVTTGGMRDETTSRQGSEAGLDWDVESAVERRCVQVMFTVPRERLRVVNAVEGEVLDDGTSIATRPSIRSRPSVRSRRSIGTGGDGGDEEFEDTLGFERYYRRQSQSASREHLKEDDTVQLRGGGYAGNTGGYVSEGEGLSIRRQGSRFKPGRGSPGLW